MADEMAHFHKLIHRKKILMAKFSVNWDKFTVLKKHDVDRDAPYLWVIGVLVDVNTLSSKNFVIRKPSGHDNLGGKFKKGESTAVPKKLNIDVEVKPILGFAVCGVVVIAWENAMTTDRVIANAYDAAADAINDFIKKRVESANLESPTEGELNTLAAQIEEDVRQTIRDGWTIFQLIADHNIGPANCLLFLQEPATKELNFRFTKKTTDYRLQGELNYTL
jgi:hypothetical protein